MKGSMLRLSAAMVAGVLFAAATAEADMMTKVGPGEGELDIVAWPGYIERGANDKNYDWVTDFEKQTGCKVNAKTAGTSDEMVSLHGANLLRIKGVLNVAGADGPIAIHGVQHLFHPPVELKAWPDADRRSRLVFITRDIDGDTMARSLAAFLGEDARPN